MSDQRSSAAGSGLALVGYRGTGKTTVGRIVAERLNRPFHDADDVLRTRFGRSIRSIFRDLGEPVFRDWEEQVLAELTRDRSAVIATGGGAIVRETNRWALRDFGFVVWLKADPSTLHARLSVHRGATDDRPGLTAAGTLQEITEVLAHRLPLYREVADAMIETEGRSPQQVAEAVLAALPGEGGHGTARGGAS